MRGTPLYLLAGGRRVGIIPAYAGNTLMRGPFVSRSRDHPRICGEHCVVRFSRTVRLGSSPHMRGTHCSTTPAQASSAGIIPAYAGNTTGKAVWSSFTRDHPRICGEHAMTGGQPAGTAGSSPHMRGTRVAPRLARPSLGIIPAYAGNTYRSAGMLPFPWDHPRICGEHRLDSIEKELAAGSSPHMRGTLHLSRRPDNFAGIIPAYAGNTHKRTKKLTCFGDHPRICGEHRISCHKSYPFSGSSPHMRGTH